jgi:GH43 family beta-xylosidase
MRRVLQAVVLALVCVAAPGRGVVAQGGGATFTNPLLEHGPDPWVIAQDGWYYYMNSMGKNITIWKTRDMTDLRDAGKTVVWTAPEKGPMSHDIWAPELHRFDGKWYLYFAADGGKNEGHRVYVLENEAADPTVGTWVMKGKVGDETNRWAIDATAFENDGPGGDHQKFLLWSGWEGANDGQQNIYMARLKNPWTVEGPRVMLSHPEYPWETVGDLPGRHVNVNEGPEILQHDGRLFLIYSASGCWTDRYELGELQASASANLMDPQTWTKLNHPVFFEAPRLGVFGPGHNGFFKSPDGTQDWIIYHANPKTHEGCGSNRSPRIQRFSWKADGSPDFGRPVAPGVEMAKPSGTP